MTDHTPQAELDSHSLLPLMRRVACEDAVAFRALRDQLWTPVLQMICDRVPDPIHARAIAAATFTEIWWLARFHSAAGTDVAGWVAGIVARRTFDFHPCSRAGSSSSLLDRARRGPSHPGPRR